MHVDLQNDLGLGLNTCDIGVATSEAEAAFSGMTLNVLRSDQDPHGHMYESSKELKLYRVSNTYAKWIHEKYYFASLLGINGITSSLSMKKK